FPQQGFFKKLWMYRFLCIVLIVAVLGVYSLSKEWINRHYDEGSYKKAWDYMYDHADKVNMKKLNRMYREANGPGNKQ
ncbi:hypothetical protein, partial [Foetidibacter luteolus]|uniref:hypothetical protein n=1 Tax=Foetidibacter luteolus TaxID=2608880 RepID=UPI001A991FD3